MQKHFVRSFATRAAPADLRRPGPYSGKAPLSRNQLGKNRLPKTHGFLGHGEPLRIKYKRRWRGGRYNYFDIGTLLQCIMKCPSVVERDRMPNPRELNYFYRGAQIGMTLPLDLSMKFPCDSDDDSVLSLSVNSPGVRHHGGFDVVAQLLNLRPYRPYLIRPSEYPSWIEEEWIERKMKEPATAQTTSSPHRHAVPEQLKKENKIKNIRGKTLTNTDKAKVIREIYKKINIRQYESDAEKRDALKLEYKRYKDRRRNEIVLEEDRLGFAMDGIRQRSSDGNWIQNEMVESDKHHFDKTLFSANGQHILFSDPNTSSHIDTEEKQMMHKEQTRRQKIKSKLSSMLRRKKKE